jgi:hypothetical protein
MRLTSCGRMRRYRYNHGVARGHTYQGRRSMSCTGQPTRAWRASSQRWRPFCRGGYDRRAVNTAAIDAVVARKRRRGRLTRRRSDSPPGLPRVRSARLRGVRVVPCATVRRAGKKCGARRVLYCDNTMHCAQQAITASRLLPPFRLQSQLGSSHRATPACVGPAPRASPTNGQQLRRIKRRRTQR